MSQTRELPPSPEEVLNEDRIQYQAMTDLSDEEYQRLADDVRERGILQPIIVDESGTILDGHHRAALEEWLDLDASREPAYVVVGDIDDSDDKLARAIKQNLIGRDSTDGVKKHAVKQYVETTWDRTDDGDLIRPETDTEVAEKLGVSRQLVNRVVKNANGSIIDHDRVKARRYYEENPDASYREVARQVDSAKATVTEWIKEDFDEGDEDNDEDETKLNLFSRNGSEEEETEELLNKIDDEDADEDVRETAERKVEEVSCNEADVETAANAVRGKELNADRETPEFEDDPVETTGDIDILNLYAGIGGNRKLWGDSVNVTAVEYDSDIANIYRDYFPEDTVIEADAHEYLLEHAGEFDFIWSSPPCPTHSQMEAMNHAQHGLRYPDMSLYQEIVLLRNHAERLDFQYCVENVISYYDPLVEPQQRSRHYFWSNFDIPEHDTPMLIKRGEENRESAPDVGTGFDYDRHEAMLGYELAECELTKQKRSKMLKNCVHPELGKHVLGAAFPEVVAE